MIKKIEGSFVSLLFAGTAFVGAWYGARAWLPELASRHGAGIDAMLHYLLSTVGALFVAGYVALAILIWQGSRRLSIGPRFASRKTEIILSGALGLGMAIIAEGGVLAIGIPVWSEYFDAQAPADATVIEVTAQQFMWNVRYPGVDGVFGRTDPKLVDDTANPLGLDRSDPAGKDDVVALNDITVPFGHAVHVRLRSKDVIHSFFLPNFRLKQDVVPGREITGWFQATKPGKYELPCAELCGFGHSGMKGYLYVHSPEEYERWVKEQWS
jgi:cytochrome c oxidase subunit 2